MKLLTIDAGNTNTVFGFFDGEDLKSSYRLKTEAGRTVDQYYSFLAPLLERDLMREVGFEAAIISSVVPQVNYALTKLVEQCFNLTPLMIGPGVKTGVSIKTKNPTAVGADRIVNAVAAKEFYGLPALVIDFGTATSFDYISADSSYSGGVIAPGLETSLDALVSKAAKLPRIDLKWPEKAVGDDTVSAMQSGAVLGYCCMVDGMIEKIREEKGEIKQVIATGGVGKLVAKNSKYIEIYDRLLTLKGLKIIAELNS